jgi:hypothetical protein
VVFLGSSCSETAKNAIKQIRRQKTTGKSFLFLNFNGGFSKSFTGVFELPWLRNAQKAPLKRSKKTKKKYHGIPFSGYLPDIRRFQFVFLNRPLSSCHPNAAMFSCQLDPGW